MKALEVRQPPTVVRPQASSAKELASTEKQPGIAGQLQVAADLGHHLDVLPIGAPGDRYEQEADRTAAQVVGRLESGRGPAAPVQATPAPGPAVQAKGEGGAGGGSAAALTQLPPATGGGSAAATLTQLPPAPGNGRPLGPAVRAPMERAFGASLGDVRLHTSGPAQQLNRSLDARATTVGRDIYFDQGEYDPDSASGRQLLAHELTHVLQQRRGGQRLQRRGRGARQDEQEQAPIGPVANNPGAQAFNQGAAIHLAAGQQPAMAHDAAHIIQQAPPPAPPVPAAPAPAPAAAGPAVVGPGQPQQAPPNQAGPEQAAPYLMPAGELNYNPQRDDDLFYRED